jgi:Helix-turn-helix domain
VGTRYAAVPVRAAAALGLGAQDFRVLIAIASHANGDGRAFPSLARIALLTGIARRNVPRSIARLEDARLLRHRQRKGETGGWGHSVYEIVLEDLDVAPSEDWDIPPNGGLRRLAKAAPSVNGHISAEHFELFWEAYPSRGPHPNPKKPAASKFAAALKNGVDPAIIIAGTRRYADYVAREERDPRYVKQAMTWLSQELWNEAYKLTKVRPSRARVGAI